MPAKKDNKSSIQSQSILSFFGAKPAAPTETKRATPAKASSSTKPKPSKSSKRPLVHAEVIVIESDSDDEVEIVETFSSKRRKLSPKNTDAPKREETPVKANASRSSVEFVLKENAQPILGDIEQPQTSIFGVPFLLTNPKKKTEDSACYVQSFGEPSAPLAMPMGPPSPTAVGSISSSAVPIASSSRKPECSVPDMDITLGDWDNGDDETGRQARPDSGDGEDGGVPDADDSKQNIDAAQLSDDVENYEDSAVINDEDDLEEGASAKPQPISGNAFSFMMSSHKENEIWKEASQAERKLPAGQRFNNNAQNGRRKAPFYKVLTGMPIAVDAFKYGAITGVSAYFLTHAHSDHYTNLSASWKHGPIYCSQATANLIIHMLSVDPKWVHPLPMDTPTVVPNTNGVTVTLIEANHCPGSCLFFFEGKQTVNAGDSNFKSQHVGSSKVFRYLHCGDFRASPQHVLHPAVQNKVIDLVYLDTTYLDPKYTFPPQPLVISACAEVAKRAVCGQSCDDTKSTMMSWMSIAGSGSKGKAKEQSRIRTLVVVGTYSIGKERIVKDSFGRPNLSSAIAHALDSKVYCDKRKAAILRCQGDKELDSMLTSDPQEASVHLVPLSTIDSDHMKTYLERFAGSFGKVIGFRPTGWTFTQAAGTDQSPSISSILAKASALQNFKYTDLKPTQKSTSTLTIYPVPYSEHSSFYELTCFAMSFDWVKMIATVNVGSEKSRGKMAKWVAKWDTERRRKGKTVIVPHRHPDYW
ncbi:hypothetical protein D9619_006309 [Psilocybe cf. subviscida]|uniref:DNA repair metallo-beta-lactamase domain-containing protein n=1 Tax=Psilocybe cf. subviscida TaxID=2480587 RepID=A0A8H5EXY1_9AGAR|nr:hypothetical protein D9619_006309 [Psilocybe cf. subviscida]